MNIYFISGLGADRSIFKHIQLPEDHKAIHLDWITPHLNETLPDYAMRLAGRIDTNEPFALVGLSLGGMMAAEIAKRTKPAHLFLISSIPTIAQLPFYFRLAGTLRLHRVVPVSFIQQVAFIKRFFTTETAEDKQMLKALIRKTDAAFIKWAFGAVLSWRNKDVPPGMIHIHGTRDQILPKRFTKPTHIIMKGGHLMVLNRAAEISEIFRLTLAGNGDGTAS